MSIEKDLQHLVRSYASLNEETQRYEGKPGEDQLLNIDKQFTQIINKYLISTGIDKKNIESEFRKLSRYFHPDRLKNIEVIWLEAVLSDHRNNGVCFSTLTFCKEKLLSPEKFKNIKSSEIKTREDLKQWLEQMREQSCTYSRRKLYSSLLDLLDVSGSYFDEVGKLNSKGLRALLIFFPIIFSSFAAVLAAEELFAVYSLYFLLFKGGRYLEHSNFIELQQLGQTLQEVSLITASMTTTLLARLLELTFWTSQHCYDMSLKIGSNLFNPILISTGTNETELGKNFCKELILANQSAHEGMEWITPELKLVAAPMEAYLAINSQQFFKVIRVGGEKRKEVKEFLNALKTLDNDPGSLEKKLDQVQKVLEKLMCKSEIYTSGSKMALAIDRAREVVALLLVDREPVVTVYDAHALKNFS